MSELEVRKSRQVLWAFAIGTAVIGLVTLVVEIATGRQLGAAVGLPVFVSTPLGVGAVFLALLTLRNDRRGLIPLVLAAAYWILFFVYL